ncbi:hypothetical protein [Acetobacter nitrogenifigens]|uniref:hypothetical protein n=1 Tax=Acetobacter nitrogenifigens TaxID=285268 RepID=UPI00040DB020|nr:hypothetical protein [Acetobacter nitrogenifigens]
MRNAIDQADRGRENPATSRELFAPSKRQIELIKIYGSPPGPRVGWEVHVNRKPTTLEPNHLPHIRRQFYRA